MAMIGKMQGRVVEMNVLTRMLAETQAELSEIQNNNFSSSFQKLTPNLQEEAEFSKFNIPSNVPSAIKAQNSSIPAFLSPIKPKSQTPSAIIEEAEEEEEKLVNVNTPFFKFSISPDQKPTTQTNNPPSNIKNPEFSNPGVSKYLNNSANSSSGNNKSGISEFESMLRRGEQHAKIGRAHV